MPGCNKRPDFISQEEAVFYEKTSKRELFLIGRYLAMQTEGEDFNAIFDRMKEEKKALRDNGII